MKIYIGGNNGVGKTTIIKKFSKNNDYFAIVGSELTTSITRLIPKTPETEDIITQMFKQEYLKHDNLIIDGHFYIGDAEKSCFDLFIIMTAKPEIVLERRLSNSEKNRETTMESVLKEEEKTITRAIKSGVQPIFVLYNNGNIEQTLSDLKKIISFYDFISKNKITVVSDIMKLAHRNNIFLIQDISLGMADRNFEKQEGIAI